MTPLPEAFHPAATRPCPCGVHAPGAVGAGPRIGDRDTARQGADRDHRPAGRLDERGLAFGGSRGGRFQMASLIYSAIASLDGYVEDERGNFDWAAPDEEVHAFVNDLERPVGTYLYGRHMYETMVYWETDDDQAAVTRDFAEIWRAAEKVVYSRTLQTVSSERRPDRARVRRRGDQAAEGELAIRHHDRRGGARRPRDRRGVGRRVPSLPRAGPRGRWQARPARRRPYRARAVGRAPLSQRRRVPPLPFLSRQEHDVDIGAGLQRPDQRMSPPDVENRAPAPSLCRTADGAA
jgi:hypothetical protein